ncbi:MAG TPA: HIT family protein [bacterium]|nr:HIT family protein [bacterium]
MSYRKYLETKKEIPCIFCSEEFRATTVRSYDQWFVVPNRAPYCADHLMIVPHAHFERVGDISSEAWIEFALVMREVSDWIYSRDHGGYNLLVRDEQVPGAVGKSIPHLHFHIVPKNIAIMDNPGERHFYTFPEIMAQVKDISDSWPC